MKAFGGETVSAGSVIVRQRGTRIHPGDGVGKGSDDTLFALREGTVTFAILARSQVRLDRSRRIAAQPRVRSAISLTQAWISGFLLPDFAVR